jgi:hypothetical protein
MLARAIGPVAVVIGIGVAQAPSLAVACSCAPIARDKMLPTVSDVFIATVVGESEPPASPAPGTMPFSPEMTITYELEVASTLKGDAKGRVAVVTGRDSATCGFPFQKGRRYLVFARRGLGVLRTGLCFGNVEGDAIDAAAAEVKKLVAAKPKGKPRKGL